MAFFQVILGKLPPVLTVDIMLYNFSLKAEP